MVFLTVKGFTFNRYRVPKPACAIPVSKSHPHLQSVQHALFGLNEATYLSENQLLLNVLTQTKCPAYLLQSFC